MTIKEHLEPVIKNLPGLPAQRLHQLLHPPRDIIPAGITHKHRIPGAPRKGGVLRIRWRYRHDILLRIAEQPLRTLLTDRTADGPGQVSPTRGSGPSTRRQKWFRHSRSLTLTCWLNQLCPIRSWLNRPASASKPVESKPPCTHPRTRDRACYSTAGWFRHRPLLRRDPAQPALSCPKLVEPTSERQRASRVETTVHTSENSRSGLLFSCRMVSTRAARPSRPGSTSFRDDGVRFPAGRCGAVASDRFRAAGRSTVRQWCRPGGSVVC